MESPVVFSLPGESFFPSFYFYQRNDSLNITDVITTTPVCVFWSSLATDASV